MSRTNKIRSLRFGWGVAVVTAVVFAMVLALQVPSSVTYAKKVHLRTGCERNCLEAYVEALRACDEFQIRVADEQPVDPPIALCELSAELARDHCLARCGGGTSDPT